MITTTILSILLIISIGLNVGGGFVIYAFLQRKRETDTYFNKLYDTVEWMRIEIEAVDANGHFEADDEVGVFFKRLKSMSSTLSKLFADH